MAAYQRLSYLLFIYMEQKCPQISHLAGSATANVHGTVLGPLPKAHYQREKRLKQQTLYSLSRSESFSTQSLTMNLTSKELVHQVPSVSSALTPKLCSVLSASNTKLSRTIRSFGWQSSSAKRLTWTASSFYQMVPKSVLPPHSVVRRRTSSLVIQSNDASLAT